MKTWGNTAATLSIAALLFGIAGPAPGAATPAHAISTAAPVVAPVVVARYTFDTTTTGSTVVDDSGRGHTLTPSTARGGKVRLAERASGRAAAFPAKCSGKKCPHAVLQAPDAPDLNPGTGPVRFGATIRLRQHRAGSGQNIVQKGYSASGSQYKLQVDGAAGRPSCVVADNVVRGIHVARSDVAVTDGAWHRLECRRAGTALILLVDDVVHATATIPATLSVTNTVPLSIGGKGDGADNDQFHGSLDDVWIALG
ncbi:LamG domain-containing protein [Dactylosporangium roseum]|uniref:LamG domain-containing protein n=1 Tax=Dactylosporangium roseum TaxID=47989 RepID=A0ABY5ZDP5_9ACTN|nr:LamG domain-containing protein [Dactylosporangium roseum]UWZ38808.1 LamG domain-containing protein [Dactylosporangium roseum]